MTDSRWNRADRARRAWDYAVGSIDRDEGAPGRGLLRSYDARTGGWVKPYPEVTGYTIRGLLEASRGLSEPRYEAAAVEMGRALLGVQQTDGPARGAVPAADLRREYYVFDTAQAIEGLMSLHEHTNEESYLAGAVRAGEFCLSLQNPEGSFIPAVIGGRPYEPGGREDWGLRPSYIQIRGATGWRALARSTGDPRFDRMTALCRDWVLAEIDGRYPDGLVPPCRPRGKSRALPWPGRWRRRALPERATYTHPGAYVVRGLLEDFLASGEPRGLEVSLGVVRAAVLPHIRDYGYLPYGISLDGAHRPVTDFSYVSGQAQYAWLLCRLWQITRDEALLDAADRLLGYCAKVQDAAPRSGTGGLFQYAASDAAPHGGIHRQLHVWGTKFFAEALMLRDEIERIRTSAPADIAPVAITPWTSALVEEKNPGGPVVLRFRAPRDLSPVTLCMGTGVSSVTVGRDSGTDVPAVAVPGFPGVFRIRADNADSCSVFLSPEDRDARSPRDGDGRENSWRSP